MQIEDPAINRIERTGYYDVEYIEWEMRNEREEIVEDSEAWPDGLTFTEWQKEKRTSARMNA